MSVKEGWGLIRIVLSFREIQDVSYDFPLDVISLFSTSSKSITSLSYHQSQSLCQSRSDPHLEQYDSILSCICSTLLQEDFDIVLDHKEDSHESALSLRTFFTIWFCRQRIDCLQSFCTRLVSLKELYHVGEISFISKSSWSRSVHLLGSFDQYSHSIWHQ